MEEKCHHSSTDLNTNDTTLMAESKEKLKSFLMRVKEENEKACSKLNVKKKTIMASRDLLHLWHLLIYGIYLPSRDGK